MSGSPALRALRRLDRYDDAVRERMRGEVARALGARVVGAPVSDEAQIAAALSAHRVMETAGPRDPALLPACGPGCAYCCHVHAYATRPEVLAVADHLRRTLDPAALAALHARLARHVAMVAPLSDEARWAAKIPCALLDPQGRCSIHPVRPLRCRAFHSCSVTPCKDAFEGREDEGPQRSPLLARAMDAAESGYDQALSEAGISIEGERLEGLLLALIS